MSAFFKTPDFREGFRQFLQEYPPLNEDEDYDFSLEDACRSIGLSVVQDSPVEDQSASSTSSGQSSSKPNPYTMEGIRQLLNSRICVNELRPVRVVVAASNLLAGPKAKAQVALSSEAAFARAALTSPQQSSVRQTKSAPGLEAARPRALTAPAGVPAGSQALVRGSPARQRRPQHTVMVPRGNLGSMEHASIFNKLSRNVEAAVQDFHPNCADFSFSGNFIPDGFGLRIRSQSQSVRYDARNGQTLGRYAVETLERDTRGQGHVYRDNVEMQGSVFQVTEAMQALHVENEPRRR